MGVYGTFAGMFPELMETISVWSKPDKSDERQIRAIFWPKKGSDITRKKYPSASWELDITDNDALIVPVSYASQIKVGDYCYYRTTRRVSGDIPFDVAADFIVFTVERLVGALPQQNEPLKVKEPVYL